MTTTVLAPVPKERFCGADGLPLVGGKFFVYAAGTTTKQVSYTDATGTTPNTNPVILDARGEANVWLDSTLAYKFVLSPSTDTDPPTAAIWTVDNVPGVASLTSLGSTISAAQGAGMIGFLYSLVYAANTVGGWLQALATSVGATFIGFILGFAGAVTRTLQSFLRDLPVTPQGFGALGDNVADDTAAFVLALATGRHVFVPADKQYKLTAGLSLATAYQRIFSVGWTAILSFTFAAPAYAITTSNSTGWQQISGMQLNGIANVTALINIGSPDLKIYDNYIVNATATGHGIWQSDENTGANTYVFDARIEGNLIFGVKTAGNYGIRLGLNHQGTKVLRNSVQNWGYHMYINGATTGTTVMYNIFQRTDTVGALPAAIAITKAGSGMPCYNIRIEYNYFEQNQVCVYVDDCALVNFSFSKNYCFRNTATAPGSYVYSTGVGSSAASGRIHIDDNYIDGFSYVANLANQYAANIVSCKDNNVLNNTGYATGAFATSIYKYRAINAYFGNVLLSGAFSSTSVTRMEFGNTSIAMKFPWDTMEYLESVTVRFIVSGGAPTINLSLHQVVNDVDTVIATTGAIAPGSSIVTLPVNAYAIAGAHYYLSDVGTAGGGTGYRYPYYMLIRG